MTKFSISVDEDGPWLDLETKDGNKASINLRRYAQAHDDKAILQWCEEQLGRPLYRRLQVVETEERD